MKKVVVVSMLCLLVAGCAISHKSRLSHRGAQIDQDQVAMIQPGATDKDWVLRNLGTPDRIHADKDGLEVFEYVSREHEKVDTRLLFLLSVETDKIVLTTVTRIVMRGGVVQSVDTTET